MPFALVIIGLIMIVSGARNTYAALGSQLQSDFTGPNNFLTWVLALGIVGSVGYVEKLRSASHAFMALILIGMVLSNRGFFAQFEKAMTGGPVAPSAAVSDIPSGSTSANVVIDTVKKAATGNNPGSDLIGQITSKYLTIPFFNLFK